MHYHYFTLEQRSALEAAIRSRLAEPGMKTAMQRLHTAGDIAYVRLAANPRLRRCPDCLSAL
jgi:hypothetical protein